MIKLDLEKAEEAEINCQHPLGHRKSKRIPEKHLSALLTMAKPLAVWITINWKILKEMGIPDHLTSLLRNLYPGTGHGTTDWFQIGKEECQGCILSSYLFNLYAEYIMWHAGLNEAWARMKITRRNINNLRFADDTTLKAESEKELKHFLMKVKEESEKRWVKTQHLKNEDHGTWSHHLKANRWGNNGNSDRLYFFGLQNHCR